MPRRLKKTDLFVDKEFNIGEIWQIYDELLAIPDADRVQDRNVRNTRPVVIVDNNDQNSIPTSPVITVAPLSSRSDLLRPFDIELSKGKDGVVSDSILRMRLVQPILKADLYKKLGEISEDKKAEIIYTQLKKVGYDIDSDIE